MDTEKRGTPRYKEGERKMRKYNYTGVSYDYLGDALDEAFENGDFENGYFDSYLNKKYTAAQVLDDTTKTYGRKTIEDYMDEAYAAWLKRAEYLNAREDWKSLHDEYYITVTEDDTEEE